MSRAKKDIPPRFPEFRDAFLELMGDMTLDQFSKKLEMSRATVGFYAAGQRIPDALGLKKIAEKCNVSADWLLGLSSVKSQNGEIKQVCAYTGLSEAAISILNSSKYKGSAWNMRAGLINEILKPECISRYSSDTWRCAMMNIQINRFKKTKSEEKMRERIEYNDALAKDVLDDGADSLISKIPVIDAARFYRDSAVNHVSYAAQRALNNYVELAIKEVISFETEE